MSNRGTCVDPNLLFDIFFQINHQEAFRIRDLDRSTYVKLKHNDSFAVEYISNLIATGEVRNEEGESIETLFRSIDDVDYVRVNLSSRSTPTSPTTRTRDEIVSIPENSSSEIERAQQSKSVTKATAMEPLHISETRNRTSHPVQPEQSQQTSSAGQVNSLNITNDTTKSSKSEAWKHFKKIDNTLAQCNICCKSIKHSGNTTNLMQHIRHAHSMHLPLQKKRTSEIASENERPGKRAKSVSVTGYSEDVDDPSSKTEKMVARNQIKTSESQNIKKAFQRMSSFQGGGSSTAKITNTILYMISVDNCPLSIVENKGFKALLKITAPLYSVPSRKTITRELESKYEQMKNVYRGRLALKTTHTLTCDIWTDTANQSYLGITNHYLSRDFKLMNGCLGVFPLHERHTAVYISEKLKSSLESFGIERSSVTAIVTDCGANILKAAVDTFGASKHVPCLAHVLSHVVPSTTKKLPAVEKIITRVKDIVTITKRSVVASDELIRLQICNGKTAGTALKLKQDVPTRWNSSFYMMQRFLELRDYVYPVLMKCPSAPEMLTREEIEILEDCVQVLSPIEHVIREISGETYSTGSMAIPIIRCMEITLTQCVPTTKIGETFKSAIIAKVQEKFKEIETYELLAISTILDPRFKKIHFQSALTVASTIRKINNLLKSDGINGSTRVQFTPTSKSKPSTSSASVIDVWKAHDSLAARHMDSSGSDSSELNLDLRQYLNQPIIPRDKSPIEYWRSVKEAFPTLYTLAIKYLNVVATSVPSERLFSKAGALKTERRNRLADNDISSRLHEVGNNTNYQGFNAF